MEIVIHIEKMLTDTRNKKGGAHEDIKQANSSDTHL